MWRGAAFARALGIRGRVPAVFDSMLEAPDLHNKNLSPPLRRQRLLERQGWFSVYSSPPKVYPSFDDSKPNPSKLCEARGFLPAATKCPIPMRMGFDILAQINLLLQEEQCSIYSRRRK
jgi:hypothetical protein